MPWKRKNLPEELSEINLKPYEATDAEETEEFSWHADVYAPQFNKRLPEGTAPFGKRVPLTEADKKVVNKASISLPVARTLKLFTCNCQPFIFEDTIPLEEFRERYSNQWIKILRTPEFDITSKARRPHVRTLPELQQRNSLGGTTLHSTADLQFFAALPDLLPNSSEVLQNPHNTTSPVNSDPRPRRIKPEVLAKVRAWLDHVDKATAAEPKLSSPDLPFVINDDVLWLTERSDHQRKFRREVPDTMLTETKDSSIRGSSSSRPSGSYSRPDETNKRTAANPIKNHPGTSARRPKSMPSGSQLPPCWNDEMDEFICHMDAQGEFSLKSIVRALKQRFPELREVGRRCFSSQAHVTMLTLHSACDSGRGHPTSHRHR